MSLQFFIKALFKKKRKKKEAADGWVVDLAPGWEEALCVRTGWSLEVTAAARSQQDFSKAIDALAFRNLVSQCEEFDKARLLSVSGDGASLAGGHLLDLLGLCP